MNESNDYQEYSDGLIEAFNIAIDYILLIFLNEQKFFLTLKNHLNTKFFLSYKQTHWVLAKILEFDENAVASELELFSARATLFKNLNRFSPGDRLKILAKIREIENTPEIFNWEIID